VFILAERLLKMGYIIGVDNYYSIPELFHFLNDNVTGTVIPNRKELPKDVMGKILKRKKRER
jgi:hypothetical protein